MFRAGRAAGPGPLRFSQVLGRLALAGLIAGVLAAGWLLLATERVVATALAVEDARQAAGTAGPHEHPLSRTTQQLGGAGGMVLLGVAVALVLTVVFALLRHRLPGRTDSARVAVLAGIGFAVFGLLPAITVPANPPGIGNEATVETRTAVYLVVLLAGVDLAVLIAILVGALRGRGLAVAPTAVAATVLGVVLVALLFVFLPENPDAIPADVPASLVWDYRLAALGQHAVFWGGLGLAGGWLLDRAARTDAPPRQGLRPTPSDPG